MGSVAARARPGRAVQCADSSAPLRPFPHLLPPPPAFCSAQSRQPGLHRTRRSAAHQVVVPPAHHNESLQVSQGQLPWAKPSPPRLAQTYLLAAPWQQQFIALMDGRLLSALHRTLFLADLAASGQDARSSQPQCQQEGRKVAKESVHCPGRP